MTCNSEQQTVNRQYVLIATGEYSDYSLTAFRILKPFTFKEAYRELLKQFIPDDWKEDPTTEDFIAFLNKAGYIEDADELIEFHIGSYGWVKMDEEQINILCVP